MGMRFEKSLENKSGVEQKSRKSSALFPFFVAGLVELTTRLL